MKLLAKGGAKMKRYTLVILGIMLCVGASAQVMGKIDGEKIAPGVLESLNQADEEEKIGVIVVMREQANFSKLKGIHRLEKLNYLRNFAQESQTSILTALKEIMKTDTMKTKIGSFRSYWIFNGFYLKATKEVIYQLVKRPDVGYIESDALFTYLPDEESREIMPLDGWNIKKMGVDSVWNELGLSGKGVVIGLLDSGCDVTHPAIADKYSGYWYDAGGSPTPHDLFGHGTHMAGILVGGDGPGPFPKDIGIAYGSKLAVAKIDSNWFIYLRYILDAMQWTASLIEEGLNIRVISCSWANTDSLHLGFWWAILNLRELGIYTVAAIGSHPYAKTPGNYPICIGVGAVDNRDEVQACVGRGPAPHRSLWADTTYWGRPDWNFIKPDILAPGRYISTCETGGGYCSSNGNSPATPHVAATIALMLERNPTLDYKTIYNLILDNAYRPGIGAPYPNNNYGWGIVNAYHAVLATPELTTPFVEYLGHEVCDTLGNDNGIPDPGEVVDLYVRLKAYYDDIHGVEAILSTDDSGITIIDSAAEYGDICKDSTALNEVDPFCFSVDTSWIPGLNATFYLNINADTGSWVDTFKIQIGTPTYTVFWEDDFESGLDNWNIEGNWVIDTTEYHSPIHSARCILWGDMERMSYMTLKEPLDLSDYHFARVLFWSKEFQHRHSEGGEVYVSTPEVGWVTIGEVKNYDSLITGHPIVFDFSFFAGEPEVYLRFAFGECGSGGGTIDDTSYWYIDDVKILVDSASFVRVEEPMSWKPTKFNIFPNYPNPFNRNTIIPFELPKSLEVSIKIYNTLGQEVCTIIEGRMGPGRHTVIWNGKDKSGREMPSGIYFCRLISQNFENTQKMLLIR